MSTLKRTVRIVKGFGVNAKRISHIQKEVYRVVLRDGKSYCLKRMPMSAQNLQWVDHALQSVRRNGYRRIAWRNARTKEGRRISVRSGSASYVLVPWISGRWPNVHSRREMFACGAAIAKFHNAGGAFRRPRSGAINMLGRWSAMFRGRYATVARLVRRASRSGSSRPTDKFLTKHGKEILSYASKASSLLRQHRYRNLCRAGSRTVVLCHGDGGPSNFIKNAKGLHLIDFETLRIDLRAYDLYRLIYNSCHTHRWKFSIARDILDGYQSVTKLERADFAMLRALLRFPRTVFLSLLHNAKGSSRTQAATVREMTRALRAERGMEAFCRKLDRYARK
ncbi:phosphotransferase [Paenibacillus thermotolerans]|uniref:phosphotransferase n=1 Tax=Paenibacillus thermotolerans TaxID=3027807 RepID=UPI0023678C57|nr:MULTISPECIES: phosphotransferase [unclassified Paenibacillus]